jgi:uncharacterized protein (TIGR02118 family)
MTDGCVGQDGMEVTVHKLMVIFHAPPDYTTFERSWSETFVSAAEKMPGLQRVAVSRVVDGPGGPVDIHLVHEFFFEDLHAVQEAMASAEGRIAGHALMTFASEKVTLCYAEHVERAMDPPEGVGA